MGVRAADESERAALLLGRREKVLDERVVLVGHRAVLHLEDVEELEHRREEVLRGLPHAVRLEEVVRGIEQSLAPEVLDEVEDVPPLPVDDLPLGEREVEDVHVDAVARAREERLDLGRDEEVRVVRVAVLELQAAVHGVVVRERHEVHAARLREAVRLVGVVVRVARVRGPEVLEDGRVRVQVEVRPREGQCRPGLGFCGAGRGGAGPPWGGQSPGPRRASQGRRP